MGTILAIICPGQIIYIGSYLKLRPDVNIERLEKKFPILVNRYGGKN
jgi:hypothetical protein